MPEKIADFFLRGRILCMDIGQKTIGLAVSGSAYKMALPLKTIRRKKFSEDIGLLSEIIREYEIGTYVLGWPLNMDGSRSAGCDRVQSFADEMQNHPYIFGAEAQILLWDERLSTEAVRQMVDKPVHKMKKAGELDALAALVILEGVLKRLNG